MTTKSFLEDHPVTEVRTHPLGPAYAHQSDRIMAGLKLPGAFHAYDPDLVLYVETVAWNAFKAGASCKIGG